MATLGPGCAEPRHRRGLRPSRRDADGPDHRAEGDHDARQARFQIVDIVATMKPLTKSSRQIVSAASIPTVVRDAFRVAAEERPGPVHLELPEDIAAEEAARRAAGAAAPDRDAGGARRRRSTGRPQHDHASRAAAGDVRRGRSRPRLGGRLDRIRPPHPASRSSTRRWARARSPARHGEGGTDLWMGTAALTERDYVHEAIDRADLILAIGHDTIEKPPFIMGPKGPKVIHVGYTPANVEQVYFPHAEVVGDVGPSLALLADRLEGKLPNAAALLPLREDILDAHAGPAPRSRASRSTPQRIVARRAQGDAGRRHRRARQRHVQDLVRAQLPHAQSPTRCCSTTRWRRWAPGCLRR